MNRLIRFQDDYRIIYIQEMNKKFSQILQNWLDENAYNHNTKVKTLKVVQTVCNHAKENGIVTHPELPQITKNLRYKDSDHIY